MMRATKYILIICVVLNFLGHPTESKVVGWDWCVEDGHPFWLYVFKFGWPIPVIIVNQIWGCLSTPNLWVEYSWPGLIGSSLFWIVAIWIIDTFWPTGARARLQCPKLDCDGIMEGDADGYWCPKCEDYYPPDIIAEWFAENEWN